MTAHPPLRTLINLVEAAQAGTLGEAYSSENSDLLKYLINQEIDIDDYWWLFVPWAGDESNYDVLHALSVLVDPTFDPQSEPDVDDLPVSGEWDVDDLKPDIFHKLPKPIQDNFFKWVRDGAGGKLIGDPEAPTWMYLHPIRKQLLPETTWLVHFSDQATRIAQQGFTQGVSDKSRLGYTQDLIDVFRENRGYNFALLAGSREASSVARTGKYGRHFVMFQNSGVLAFHQGDEEEQVIFYGPDVEPASIIAVERLSDGSFGVLDHPVNGEGELIYEADDYPTVVGWIMQNHQQQRR